MSSEPQPSPRQSPHVPDPVLSEGFEDELPRVPIPELLHGFQSPGLLHGFSELLSHPPCKVSHGYSVHLHRLRVCRQPPRFLRLPWITPQVTRLNSGFSFVFR
ncbi:hypothetical protein ILYODFUR_035326 [Ilyodon furcidens]|uniref:Uncharacterized protein n=1 Tax=Ilyodon furcidens TaxID=33524 RepID=A0ABV0TDS7_9TELE